MASQVNSAMTLGRKLAYERGSQAIAKAKVATKKNTTGDGSWDVNVDPAML